jgi:signal transduction histidine kinase/ActR/RegA family two-component response regulator
MQDKRGTYNPVSMDMIEFNPEWECEDSESGCYYKSGVIPQRLLFTTLGGNIKPEFAEKAIHSLESLLRTGKLNNDQYTRIADFSDVKKLPISTRILYANALNKLHDKYNCQPKITYICGASLLIKTMLRSIASYVKQNLVFVSTLQDALDLFNNISCLWELEQSEQVIISRHEMDDFASLCGQILFDETYSVDANRGFLRPDHPLHELYKIISVLNNDLRELQETEKEQNQKIKTALETSQKLNKELSEEKKIVEKKEQIQKILIENLKTARTEAEIASRAKSEFLANMSHEIRTPLHAAIGMTELLLDTPLNSQQKNYTKNIHVSTKQLHQLINDILDFSKIESGQIDQEKSLFDLRTLFNEISAILIGNAKEAGLQLTFIIPPSIPTTLSGYPNYLQQALINLIQNAIKFTYQGEVVVSIEPVTETPEDISLRISVKDTGIGIPEEKKALIFQRFIQLDSSATRKEGGTGLGLAITIKLIEFMGGAINLNSRENEGSEFWFVLTFFKPLENKKISDATVGVHLKTTPEEHYSDSIQPIKKNWPANARILVVEDNLINQQVATAMLTKLDFTVDIATNGIEAIEALKKVPYALVIMDLQMPLMGGLDATKEIRKPQTGVLNPDIPIIAITANATLEDRKSCLNAGMNDFITKPFMIQSLKDILQKWTRESSL